MSVFLLKNGKYDFKSQLHSALEIQMHYYLWSIWKTLLSWKYYFRILLWLSTPGWSCSREAPAHCPQEHRPLQLGLWDSTRGHLPQLSFCKEGRGQGCFLHLPAMARCFCSSLLAQGRVKSSRHHSKRSYGPGWPKAPHTTGWGNKQPVPRGWQSGMCLQLVPKASLLPGELKILKRWCFDWCLLRNMAMIPFNLQSSSLHLFQGWMKSPIPSMGLLLLLILVPKYSSYACMISVLF